MAATWNNTDLLMVVKKKKNDHFVLVNVKKKIPPNSNNKHLCLQAETNTSRMVTGHYGLNIINIHSD